MADRVRESLFAVLEPRIVGARFADLCAGSGAVGIEALSRGAVHALFVERSRDAVAIIQANLTTLKLTDRATLQGADVLVALIIIGREIAISALREWMAQEQDG
jgi:16S rRNA (guanine(966)-N(2))-methyltransferase RsmD